MSEKLDEFLSVRYNRLREIKSSFLDEAGLKNVHYTHQGLQALFDRLILLEGCLASVQEMQSDGARIKIRLLNGIKDLEFDLIERRAEVLKEMLDAMVSKSYSWEERRILMDLKVIDSRIKLKRIRKEVEELECFCKIMSEESRMIVRLMDNAGLLAHLIKQGLATWQIKPKED